MMTTDSILQPIELRTFPKLECSLRMNGEWNTEDGENPRQGLLTGSIMI
jgi:hypothetical protein